MKKMRYLGTNVLVLSLVMAAMSGCGEKEPTLEEILAGVKENSEAASGMSGAMEMVLDASISVSGVSMDMSINLAMDMETSRKDGTDMAHMDGTMEISALGQEMSMEMESYTVQDGDMMKSYSCTDGVWEYSEDDVEGLNEMANSMATLYEDAENWTLAEEKEEMGGVSCYVLSGTVSGKDMEAYAELTESMGAGDVDLSQLQMPVTLYVDAEKLLPVSVLVDGTEVMSKMMEGTEAEGSEFKTFTVAVNDISYGDVEITIPEEALAAEAGGSVETTEPVIDEEEADAAATESESAAETEAAASAGDVLATVVDDENVTIQITGVDASDEYEYLVNLYLENKTEKNLTFNIYEGSINGLMMNLYGGEELTAGKRANITANFYWDDIEEAGIVDITDVGMMFTVYDSDDYSADHLVDQFYHFYPQGEAAATVYERTASASDQVIVDNDYVTMTVIGFGQDELWGPTMELYLVNKMDSSTMFSMDDVSVNGFMVDPYWACEVLPGCMTYSTVFWYEDDFAANGITEIEEMEFTLSCYDSDNWEIPDYMEETFTVTP